MWLGIVQKEKDMENKGRLLDIKFLGKVGGVVSSWSRKPQIMF
jgi:hypothetical protein